MRRRFILGPETCILPCDQPPSMVFGRPRELPPFSLLQYSWKRLASELGLRDGEVLVYYRDVDDPWLAR